MPEDAYPGGHVALGFGDVGNDTHDGPVHTLTDGDGCGVTGIGVVYTIGPVAARLMRHGMSRVARNPLYANVNRNRPDAGHGTSVAPPDVTLPWKPLILPFAWIAIANDGAPSASDSVTATRASSGVVVVATSVPTPGRFS